MGVQVQQSLSGFYEFFFLYVEPASTLLPAILTFTYPGPLWFYNELIPSSPHTSMDDNKTLMAVLQLVNCYFLLSLLSSFTFRAIRDHVPDPSSQEKLVKAILTPLAIADVTHTIITLVALPPGLRTDFLAWNATTHGNITFTVILFATRISWIFGIGRQTHGPKPKQP